MSLRSKTQKAKKFGTPTTPTTTTPKAPSPRATGGTPTVRPSGTPTTKPTGTRRVIPQSAAGIAAQEQFKRNLQQILHSPLSFFSSSRTQALEKSYGDERRIENKERLKQELDKERQELKNVELAFNVNQIIGVLESGGQVYPDWFNNNIVWVKTGQITSEAFLTTYYYLSNQGQIHAPIAEPIIEEPIIEEPIIEEPIIEEPIIELPELLPEVIAEPQIDDSITTNMVTQQVINFNIVNGRAIGSIRFVATNNFNPYYYNKEIINLVQFKTPNGVTLLVKENRLRFTNTERDEIINYDENIQENTRITVESFVWEWIDKPAGAFSNKYTIDISEKEPPKPIQAGFMGAGIAGAIAGLILIGFIADHKRRK
jgi:hypothetical protein